MRRRRRSGALGSSSSDHRTELARLRELSASSFFSGLTDYKLGKCAAVEGAVRHLDRLVGAARVHRASLSRVTGTDRYNERMMKENADNMSAKARACRRQ